ncbi:hypothetical protein [Guptibacillus hwajinpoensis]|uniref:hypothetical protein n=1 Tax=Guptibacillus hwajinpoensis TaxID=208199 RepID=UPI001CFC696B|nr:hypothetical protein [Pseudalkalibacillus hwajinpoensis]WLR59186.1 hypothetical protein LC071_18905 [Pseudalkalibacillus hwajinpoensis]
MKTWTLSKKEIYLIVKFLGGKVLIGISSPFDNPNEMKHAWEETFKKLYAKNLVNYTDEELKFEESFIQAMWVLAKTNLIVEITTDLKGQSLFYFGDEHIIECKKLDNCKFQVYVHSSPDVTWRQVIVPRMLMGLEHLPDRLNQELLLDPIDYNQYIIKRRIHNVDEVIQNNQLNKNSMLLSQFKRAIQRYHYSNRLIIYYKQDDVWNIEGVHVLSSPSYNWTLKMSNQDGCEWLEAKQSSGTNLLQEILSVMERVKVPPKVSKEKTHGI